jgi:phosphotransferase system enzyme I (PtsI)
MEREDVLIRQLRAILRVSTRGDVRIMLPMISSLEELQLAKTVIDEVKTQLLAEGQSIREDIQIGIMIEVPSAALTASVLAAECDFFSIGTNDLTQYTLAVDRGNARLARRFSPLHPAVIRQLDQVRRAASAARISAGVCGEMAGDPIAIVALLGLGYDSLSVAPPALPLARWVIRHMPAEVAVEATARALLANDTEEVITILREALGRHLDLRLVDPAGALPRLSGGTSLPLTP